MRRLTGDGSPHHVSKPWKNGLKKFQPLEKEIFFTTEDPDRRADRRETGFAKAKQ
jgi:hypothetical protein